MKAFTIKLPVAGDAFGRWLEEHGAAVTIQCMLGKYHVTVEWRKVHSYSSEDGVRREEWEVSRDGPDLPDTFNRAVAAAIELAK